MGIGLDTSTFTSISETQVMLSAFALKVAEYEKKIYKLERYLDRSKHHSNTKHHNKNITIKKTNIDANYPSLVNRHRKIKTLIRNNAAYIKQCYE